MVASGDRPQPPAWVSAAVSGKQGPPAASSVGGGEGVSGDYPQPLPAVSAAKGGGSGQKLPREAGGGFNGGQSQGGGTCSPYVLSMGIAATQTQALKG